MQAVSVAVCLLEWTKISGRHFPCKNEMEKRVKCRNNILIGRCVFSALIIVIYFIGRNIPIPWIVQTTAGNGTRELTRVMFGTENGRLTVFSLGLGPWMSAKILVRFIQYLVETGGKNRNIGWEKITLVIAVMNSVTQAYLRTIDAATLVTDGGSLFISGILSVLLLETGALLTMWLANRNTDWGIGGHSLLIAANILDRLRNILFSDQYRIEDDFIRILIIVYIAAITFVVFLLEDAELHIHVNRIMINNFLADDYIAIKGNPGGSMSMVYGMALYSLLGMLTEYLEKIFPCGIAGLYVSDMFDMTSFIGTVAFVVIMWLVTALLPLITIKPSELADGMKKSNEYTENIEPGKKTYFFLRDRILLMSICSATILCILVIIPFVIWTSALGLGDIQTLPITWSIYVGILLRIVEEGKVYHTMQHYKMFD